MATSGDFGGFLVFCWNGAYAYLNQNWSRIVQELWIIVFFQLKSAARLWVLETFPHGKRGIFSNENNPHKPAIKSTTLSLGY